MSKAGTRSATCKSCTAEMEYNGMFVQGIVDDKGRVVYLYTCETDDNGKYSSALEYTYNDDGSYTYKETYEDGKYYIESINSKGFRTSILLYYNDNATFSEQVIVINDGNKELYEYSGCDQSGKNCTNKDYPTNWDEDGTMGATVRNVCPTTDPMCAGYKE